MPKIVSIILSGIVLIVLLVMVISFAANALFNRNVTKEVNQLFEGIEAKEATITEKDLQELPKPVQNWLESSKIIGKQKITSVRLKQKAQLRTKQDAAWMPAEIEQYFTVDKPGFIWKVNINANPVMKLVGRDKYYEGKGHMLIKLFSFITVADGKGKEIDQGTLLRYLAETVWFPTAALSDYIKWEAINDKSAKATMSYGDITASGVFTFNEKGEVISFVAERYMDLDGKYSLETWCVLMKEHKEFNGVHIPYKGELVWKLKSGDFKWYDFEITEVEYNKPSVY